NLGGGIQLAGDSQGTRILDNLIGTDKTGQQPLGNAGSGILALSSRNQIGDIPAGAGNVIAFNPVGILVDRGTSNGIHANSIFSNIASGIVLENNGNGDQPAPRLTGASRPTPTTIQVTGTLKAAANTKYQVEIFASPSNTSPGQGQNFLGFVQVTTNP